jgi:hypothetical protein
MAVDVAGRGILGMSSSPSEREVHRSVVQISSLVHGHETRSWARSGCVQRGSRTLNAGPAGEPCAGIPARFVSSWLG